MWSAGCIIAEFITNKPLFEVGRHIWTYLGHSAGLNCKLLSVLQAPSDQDMISSMQSLLGPLPNVLAATMVSLGLPRDKVRAPHLGCSSHGSVYYCCLHASTWLGLWSSLVGPSSSESCGD